MARAQKYALSLSCAEATTAGSADAKMICMRIPCVTISPSFVCFQLFLCFNEGISPSETFVHILHTFAPSLFSICKRLSITHIILLSVISPHF